MWYKLTPELKKLTPTITSFSSHIGEIYGSIWPELEDREPKRFAEFEKHHTLTIQGNEQSAQHVLGVNGLVVLTREWRELEFIKKELLADQPSKNKHGKASQSVSLCQRHKCILKDCVIHVTASGRHSARMASILGHAQNSIE